MSKFVVVTIKNNTVEYLTKEDFESYDEGCAWANRHVFNPLVRIWIEESVNHPIHYNSGKIETIDKIQAECTQEEFRGFLKGNIIKYKDRHLLKGGVRDLMKAKWYEDKLKTLGDKNE